ncbi:serine/threonine protein phosphatase [Candidatus Babeliales bacterium]|nr:serine/threonine protein phosphatase [Candidatus Babeliales bacterium]
MSKRLILSFLIGSFFIFITHAESVTLAEVSGKIFSQQKEYGQPLHVNSHSSNAFPGDILPSIKKEDFEKAVGRLYDLFYTQLCESCLSLDNQASYIQKVTLDGDVRVVVIGDLHGSVHSLLRNLLRLNHDGFLDNNFKLAKNCYFIFTGDYADRGCYGVEVWYLLTRLKLANSDRVFLIRGNHETGDIKDSSFNLELKHKYCDENLNNKIYDLFGFLPVAVLIGRGENYVMACHGGLPVNKSGEFLMCDEIKDFVEKKSDKNIDFMAIKSHEIIQQFLWNDFIDGGSIKVSHRNPEHAYEIGIENTEKMFELYGFKALLRGHDHNKHAVIMYERNTKGLTVPDFGEFSISFCENKGLRNNKLYSVSDKIFTFMSCPEGLGGVLARRALEDCKKCNVDGYGILHFDSATYAPTLKACGHELPASEDRDRKYVRKIESDDGKLSFEWFDENIQDALLENEKEALFEWLESSSSDEEHIRGGFYGSGKLSPEVRADMCDWLEGGFRL